MSKRVPITGKTYDIRDSLKALGGIWDPKEKRWMVPEENAADAQALVNEVADQRVPPGGELWQECRRSGCQNEPSYSCCECCREHCDCEGRR